jgi:IMP dehydrogenase
MCKSTPNIGKVMQEENRKMIYEPRFLPGLDLYGFSFGDMSLRDGYANFGIDEVDTSTKLTRRISLKIPIVGAPMDTVTEADMAIRLALEGGIGIIHYNFKDLGRIITELERVKRYESGFVEYPITLSPHSPIGEAAKIMAERGISHIPITKDGKPNGKLVGMLDKYDYSMLKHGGMKVGNRMRSAKKLITVRWSEMPESPEEKLGYANDTLLEGHAGILPIVDDKGHLMYIVTRSDIEKNEQYPLAAKDSKKRLRCGISVAAKDEYIDIAKDAIKKGADVIVIDTAKGNTEYALKFLKRLKELSDDVDVIGGTVSTAEGAINLIKAGSDAIRVNGASGSTCITEIMTGVGVPQGTAILDCAQAARRYAKEGEGPVPIIADGAMENLGDFVKALSLEARSCMTGRLIAGCNEAPGWKVDPNTGMRFKTYRGMGSEGAMRIRSHLRYGASNVPEGVEGEVEPTGSVHDWVGVRLMEAVKKGMFKSGARTIEDLWKVEIGPRIKEEAGVHGLNSVRKVQGMK